MKKFIIPLAAAALLAFSCEKAPEEVAVTGVSIDRTTAELVVGETIQLLATVTPSDAAGQSIAWTSSQTKVATVNNNGLVTAIAEGKSTIRAKVGGKTATCVVRVSKEYVAVTSVTLDKNSVSLIKGESVTLVATVKPDDATHKTVSWTSSDPNVVSVDSKGKVSAIGCGSATIIAMTDNQQATCAITVIIPLESISLNKTELTLYIGQSETLIATVKPDDTSENTISWASSDIAVATIDSDGKVTAVGGGHATITAKAGGKAASCSITVKVPVESVSLDRNNLTLGEGESFTLKATVTPTIASDKTVTWSSSDESIASVNQDGVVNAIKEGSASIVAKAGDKEATCIVTVIKKVTSLSLDNESLTLFVGNTFMLTATVMPEDATDKTVTWQSNNTSVATVENGVVKGIGIGFATITAIAGNYSATCRVLVLIDSASGVSAWYNGGDFEINEEVVQPGGSLVFGVRNFSSETILVISVQWIDGKTGAVTEALSIDSYISSGESEKWTIPIGDSGIYSPKARFVYTFKDESYTCEAEITDL